MDYQAQVREMLLHMTKNPEQLHQNLNAFLAALGAGISKAMSLIDNHDDMHRTLDVYLAGVAAAACLDHSEFNEIRKGVNEIEEATCEIEKQIDYEDFLRNEFHPTKMDD